MSMTLKGVLSSVKEIKLNYEAQVAATGLSIIEEILPILVFPERATDKRYYRYDQSVDKQIFFLEGFIQDKLTVNTVADRLYSGANLDNFDYVARRIKNIRDYDIKTKELFKNPDVVVEQSDAKIFEQVKFIYAKIADQISAEIFTSIHTIIDEMNQRIW